MEGDVKAPVEGVTITPAQIMAMMEFVAFIKSPAAGTAITPAQILAAIEAFLQIVIQLAPIIIPIFSAARAQAEAQEKAPTA
jgi:hypothetical protein